jgi:hypothetical protein
MSEPMRNQPARWPADSTGSIFLARVISRLPDDDLWTGLCSGELVARVYCVGRTDFGPIPLSPLAFLTADREQVMSDCQIDVRETDYRRPAAIRRAIPVPHWLYVTRSSLESFMKAKPAASVAAEGRAVRHLAEQLRLNPDMAKEKAMIACADFNLGPRAFERVWPSARSEAGLPAKGSAGRKSKRKSQQ